MKIERVISCFDRKAEDLIGEYKIDHIGFEILKSVFNPPDEDYLMYNPYVISKKQAQLLNEYVDLSFDFDKYVYQVDCFQVD